MAEERKAPSRHTVVMEQRESVSITGILDVLSFDEEAIICDTEKGVMVLRGANLHVNRLNLDHGELDVDGMIDNITYEDQSSYGKGKSSFLGKIFR